MTSRLFYEDLPADASESDRATQRQHGNYAFLSKPLLDDLARFLAGRRVLEVFAGRGQLSALLHELQVDVIPTSLRQAHDQSEELGHVVEVEDLDCVSAVLKYADQFDVLLVSWPTSTDALFRSLAHLPPNAIIVFIGEVTDRASNPPFLGGCATDEFFDSVVELPELTEQIRYPTIGCDQVKIYRLRGLLDEVQ